MRALSAPWAAIPDTSLPRSILHDRHGPDRLRRILLRASDATGIAFVELLESLWGIDRSRLAAELLDLGVVASADGYPAALSESERASVADFVAFLASRHPRRARPRG